MVTNQDKWDAQLRSFAAKELTELARDWSETEEDAAKITEETFAKRIPMAQSLWNQMVVSACSLAMMTCSMAIA